MSQRGATLLENEAVAALRVPWGRLDGTLGLGEVVSTPGEQHIQEGTLAHTTIKCRTGSRGSCLARMRSPHDVPRRCPRRTNKRLASASNDSITIIVPETMKVSQQISRDGLGSEK